MHKFGEKAVKLEVKIGEQKIHPALITNYKLSLVFS